MQGKQHHNRTGQRIALLIAGVGVFWIAANIAGAYLGWTSRFQALFDLAALAGFGLALWMVFNIWRNRRNDKG